MPVHQLSTTPTIAPPKWDRRNRRRGVDGDLCCIYSLIIDVMEMSEAERPQGDDMGQIRSRREIEQDRLTRILADAQAGTFVGTADYEGPVFRAWRAGEATREQAAAEVADRLRAAIDAAREDAEIAGRVTHEEVRHYLAEAGIRVASWSEALPGTGGHGRMSGWRYIRIADASPLTTEEAGREARIARLWEPSRSLHPDHRIHGSTGLSPGVSALEAALLLDGGEEIPLWMQDTQARNSHEIDPARAAGRLAQQGA